MNTSDYNRPLVLGPDGRPARETLEMREGFALPHIYTYQSIIGGAYKTYFHGRQDEALRMGREQALAMRRDAFLQGLMQERTLAVASLNWHLEVDDETDPVQVAVRNHLSKVVEGMRSLRKLIYTLANGNVWYGRYGIQWLFRWITKAGRRSLSVHKWKPLNGDKIGYRYDGIPYVMVNTIEADRIPGAETIITAGGVYGGKGLLLKGSWRERFMLGSHLIDDSDYMNVEQADAIHGHGVRDAIAWLNWIRLEYLGWVTDYFDRVGQGITVWYFEEGNPRSEAIVRQTAEQNSNRANILLPRRPGVTKGAAGIERIEVPTSGAEALSKLSEPLRNDIERYIIGQTMSSKADGNALGGTGPAEFQADTKTKVACYDANNTAEILTGDADEPGMIWMLQRYTFPETSPEMPGGFSVRFVFDTEKTESKDKLAGAKTIFDMGGSIKESEALGIAGLSAPGPHDKVLKQPQQQQPGMPGAPAPGQPAPSSNGNGQPPANGSGTPFQGPRGGQWLRDPATGKVHHAQRDDPAIHYAKKKEAGQWITIGGSEGEDGKKHGGSPVFVEGGRITKGAAGLHGRKIDALKEQPESIGTDRQQKNQAKGYDRARRAKEAKAEGIKPRDLHQLAGEIMAHDKELSAGRNKMLSEVRRASKALGYDLGAIRSNIMSGRVEGTDQVPGLDEIAATVAKTYGEHFQAGKDLTEQLYEALAEGNAEPMGEEQAYDQALDILRAHGGGVVDDRPIGDEGEPAGGGTDFDFGANLTDHIRDAAATAEPASALASIPTGQEGFDRGVRVVRTSPDKFRVETDRGFREGSAAETSAYIDELHNRAKPDTNRVRAALERHATAGEATLFTPEYDAEQEAWAKVPSGTRVAIAGGNYKGRTGSVYKDEHGANRVKIDDAPEPVAISPADVEPLDPKHSWRVPESERPQPAPRANQGSLFSGDLFDLLLYAWENRGKAPDGIRNRYHETDTGETRTQISPPGSRQRGNVATMVGQAHGQQPAKPGKGRSLAKMFAAMGDAEHAVAGAVAKWTNARSPALQKILRGSWRAIMVTFTAGRLAVQKVAAEKKLSAAATMKAGAVVGVVDLLSVKGVVAGLETAAAALDANLGLAGIVGAGFVPYASLAYLAYSGLTDLPAMMKGTAKAVAAVGKEMLTDGRIKSTPAWMGKPGAGLPGPKAAAEPASTPAADVAKHAAEMKRLQPSAVRHGREMEAVLYASGAKRADWPTVIDGVEYAAGQWIPAASYERDATGHEHEPAGPRGGQFTAGGGGGGSSKTVKKPPATRGEMREAKREGKGKEARVVLADGSPTPPHIKPGMIPPQWTDVTVSADPDADVLVQGRDKAGRSKTVYSDRFHMRNAEIKFARVREGLLKQQEMHDQNQLNRTDSKLKEQADCTWLMQEQATRPGSDTDTKAKVKAYGATTLEGRHVVEVEDGVRLQFVGKEGVYHDHLIRNSALAKMLLGRKKDAGDDGRLFKTDYEKVAAYARTLDSGRFTPKDFRTLKATSLATEAIRGMPRPKTEKERKAAIKTVAERVSNVLGNRPQQALESYISPTVFSVWSLTDA